MTTVGTLTVKIGADLSNLDSGIRAATGLVKGAFAGAIVKGALSLAEMAEAAEDVGHRVDVAFGDASGSVKAWAKNFADATGQSNLKVQDFLSSAGIAATNLGFSADAADDMAMSVVALGTDMAAFLGQDPGEAIKAIQSAMLGSGKAMKQYGIVLDDGSVKAEALRLGLIGVNESMTSQDKAAASLSLIMAQSNKMQGEGVKQAQDLDAQLRSLKADGEAFAIMLGGALVPVLGNMVKMARLASNGLSSLFDRHEVAEVKAEYADVESKIARMVQLLKDKPSLRDDVEFQKSLVAFQEREVALREKMNASADELEATEKRVAVILGDSEAALKNALPPADALATIVNEAKDGAKGLAENTGAAAVAAANVRDKWALAAEEMAGFYKAAESLANDPEFQMLSDEMNFDPNANPLDTGPTGGADVPDDYDQRMADLQETRGGNTSGESEQQDQAFAAILGQGLERALDNARAVADLQTELETNNQLTIDQRTAMENRIKELKEADLKSGTDMLTGMAGLIGGPIVGALAGPLLDAMVNSPDQIGEMITGMTEALTGALGAIMENMDVIIPELIEGLANAWWEMMKSMPKMIADAIKGIGEGVGEVASDFFGKDGPLDFGIFRADGGPVSAGSGYIVGEQGPEWFQPSQSGSISSASDTAAMGGGMNVTINLSGGATQGDADRVAQAILKLQKQNRWSNLVARA